jgi:hypothetical protein
VVENENKASQSKLLVRKMRARRCAGVLLCGVCGGASFYAFTPLLLFRASDVDVQAQAAIIAVLVIITKKNNKR